jgi:hypothetical protein
MRLLRPSAPLAVSFLALFVALGGVGWAASHLPRNSVGNAQLQRYSVGNAKLRPFSVGAGKIIPRAVGAAQVNSSQVQLRVAGPCTAGAMRSIAVSGDVTCTPTLPNEYGRTAQAVALGSGSTSVVSETLPPGSSYLVVANATADLSENTSGAQSVSVQCTLGLSGSGQASGGQTDGVATAELDSTDSGSSAVMIPLALPVVPTSGLPNVGVSCWDVPDGGGPAPTVTVSATINAVQTASNS